MKRLFTFGCSFTSYEWPTWVDFIEHNFDETYNYGESGAGNIYIVSKLMECIKKYIITDDDTILIMLSSSVRYDLLHSDGTWRINGNIFNIKYYDDFHEKYWSTTMGLQHTLISIELIQNILEKLPCKTKIMTAFGYDDLLEGCGENNVIDSSIIRKIKQLIPNYSLHEFCKFKNKKKSDWHEIKKNNGGYVGYDLHPTPKNHCEWVKVELPEYYNQICEEKLKKWETLMNSDMSILRENFKNEMKHNQIKKII